MNLGHHHEVNRRIAESTRYEIMTPELAAGYLARNVAFNRSRSKVTTAKYSRNFLKTIGTFFDGNALKFTIDGDLFDGQHRLSGYLDAVRKDPSISWGTLIQEHYPLDYFPYLDQGKPRTVSDFLEEFSRTHRVTLAAATGAVLRILENDGYAKYSIVGQMRGGAGGLPVEVKDFLEQNSEFVSHFINYIKIAYSRPARESFPCTTATGLILGGWIVSSTDVNLGAQWWSDIEDLSDLDRPSPEEGNPVRALAKARSGPRKANDNSRAYMYAILAADKYRRRQDCKVLRPNGVKDPGIKIW